MLRRPGYEPPSQHLCEPAEGTEEVPMQRHAGDSPEGESDNAEVGGRSGHAQLL